MQDYEQILKTIAVTMGAGWASGINLYATLLVLGVLGTTGNIVLPESLQILENPLVIGAAGFMYAAEFFVDKTPGVDTGWDAIHTFIRIPAGVMLAAGAVGDVNPAVAVAAGVLGGGLAAGAHMTKAGTRLLINTSPEPFSNWTASVLEDVVVIGGIWTALNYPLVFLGLLLVFVLVAVWLLPRIWQGIKTVASALGRLFGRKKDIQAQHLE